MKASIQSSGFVLIVDDTPTNISVLAQALRQAGLAIRIANDGVAALKQINQEQPALILLDVQMPVMDGFETCRRLKASETTSHIPIIFMTALSDKASRVKGLSLGAVDYIAKPFEQDEVLARVKVHLQLKQLTDQLEQRVEERTRELQNAQVQLVQQEKLATLGQLIAGIAHEINNPMACIANNIEPAHEYIRDLADLLRLYQQHYSDPVSEIRDLLENRDIDFALKDLPKLLDSMQLSTERIKKISISLRNFSRMDADTKVLTDIHEGLDSTLVILGHRTKSLGERPEISVMKVYGGDIPEILCFPSAINQVFMNILANAIDALENVDAPVITITTKCINSDHVAIEIADNGPGLTEIVKQRLFDPLFTTKPVGKGTGLGLSISRQIIVEKHQGQIECFSDPGKGCKFLLVLPTRTVSTEPRMSTTAALV
ncbi:MAG: two component signal transduction system histidine kinase [Phormidesmis priestleyi Ana]|uniref:histidine kinase n=1 Tax=Phormidesmis priestleyi Ana TaxID=1666911 RepID=A0A0P8A3T8_9CYAN|nr:MAG: two component signal transduction system histidine kinase [Phormidesmis priestleyi Ana]